MHNRRNSSENQAKKERLRRLYWIHGLFPFASLIRAHCPHDGRFELAVHGVHVARYSKQSTDLVHSTPRPILCIVAQGAKTILLGSEAYLYDSSRLLVLSVDLPVAAQVTRASASEPYLSLVIDLDPRRIADLVLKVYPNGFPRSVQTERRGVYLAPSNPQFLDAASRLVELMESPEDAALLAPLIVDEILIRLMRSPVVGPRLAQIGLADSSTHRVSRAIEWLRTNSQEARGSCCRACWMPARPRIV